MNTTIEQDHTKQINKIFSDSLSKHKRDDNDYYIDDKNNLQPKSFGFFSKNVSIDFIEEKDEKFTLIDDLSLSILKFLEKNKINFNFDGKIKSLTTKQKFSILNKIKKLEESLAENKFEDKNDILSTRNKISSLKRKLGNELPIVLNFKKNEFPVE